MCFASWCPHCKHMRENIFTIPAVAEYYNQNFICTQQDMEKGEGVMLYKQFNITSYPTFIFLDGNGTVLYRVAGELKAPAFLEEAHNALSPEKQLPHLKQEFENDVSNAAKCFEYLRALKKGGMDYTGMVKQYFATQNEQQLLSEINWTIIANGITDINSREFQFVLNHRKAFASLASEERVERKIFYLVKELVEPLVAMNDTLNYFAKRAPATAIHLFKVDSLIFICDVELYKRNEKWSAYQKTTLSSVETYAWNNFFLLTEIAGDYLKHIEDTAALVQAIRWVQHAVTLREDYDTYLLGAKLSRKINHKQDAALMAQKAKALAIKDGWNYTEADDLLKELQKK